MKGLKKVVSGLVAAIMVMSSLVTSVGAEGDTTNAEAAFSLKYLDSLPKEGEENFNEFLKLPDIKKLDEKREKNVKHKDGTIENVKINEEEVYGKIREKVNEIKKNVDEKKFEKEILDENIRKEYESLPEKMKIARAIYEWMRMSKNTIRTAWPMMNRQQSHKMHFLFTRRKRVCVQAKLT